MDQVAALHISGIDVPLRKTVEVATALMECALMSVGKGFLAG